MTGTSNTISIFRGNNRTLSLTIHDEDDNAYNITGCTITLYIKRQVDDADDDAVITLSGTIISGSGGIVEFYMIPDDTNDATMLYNNKQYPYDVEVVTGSGNIYTALRGDFVILAK